MGQGQASQHRVLRHLYRGCTGTESSGSRAQADPRSCWGLGAKDWGSCWCQWAAIYTQGHIVAIEDYIEYLESLGFNVDKYKEVTV